MGELAWVSLVDPPARAVSELRQNLVEYNTKHSMISEGLDLAVFLYDESGELMGGVTGNLWGEALEVDFLWVRADLRSHGLDRQILERLEEDARQRGGKVSFLNNYSFRAPEFYLKQEYMTADVIEGFPGGIQKVFFKKQLV